MRRRIAEEMAAIPAGSERLIVATGRYIGEGFHDSRLDTLFPGAGIVSVEGATSR
jgi:hypothetical protein